MKLFRKIAQRSVDPLFYRIKFRRFVRRFRSFDENPVVTDLDALGPISNVTIVVAHPDDEVFCSGIICELKKRGASIRVLCLTRGEGGPTGSNSREELGAIREAEMRASCSALGVDDLLFLGHIDPLAKEFRVFAPKVALSELAEQIYPFLADSDLVISHGSSGEYWHPGHLLVFDGVGESLGSAEKEGPAWLTFLAADFDHPIQKLINKDDPAFLRIDVAAHSGQREKAIKSHQSQLGLFGRFAGGDYREFIRKTSLESYALHRPGKLQIAETADKGESQNDGSSHA